MKLLTKKIETQLRKNWKTTIESNGAYPPDFKPVLKVFNPCGDATWLFTELSPDGTLYGLCDLGHGSPELGYASLAELSAQRVGPFPFDLKLERDMYFKANKTLSEYATDARHDGVLMA